MSDELPTLTDEDLAKVMQELEDDEHVVDNEDGTFTVLLDVPIKALKKRAQRGEDELEEIDSLTFRRPSAKDWLETDKEKGQLGKSFRLAAHLCGLSYANFLKLDGEDAMRCSMVANTMGKRSRTGGTS